MQGIWGGADSVMGRNLSNQRPPFPPTPCPLARKYSTRTLSYFRYILWNVRGKFLSIDLGGSTPALPGSKLWGTDEFHWCTDVNHAELSREYERFRLQNVRIGEGRGTLADPSRARSGYVFASCRPWGISRLKESYIPTRPCPHRGEFLLYYIFSIAQIVLLLFLLLIVEILYSIVFLISPGIQ